MRSRAACRSSMPGSSSPARPMAPWRRCRGVPTSRSGRTRSSSPVAFSRATSQATSWARDSSRRVRARGRASGEPVEPIEPPSPIVRPPRPATRPAAARRQRRRAGLSRSRRSAIWHRQPGRADRLRAADLKPALDAGAARVKVRALLDPAPALLLRMAATIRVAQAESAPRTSRSRSAIRPRFPQPMSEPLAALSQDWLLPGLERVPPDSVAMLEPNQRFIEAFMLGLNVEMGRELLVARLRRRRPRATYFRRFWRAVDPQEPRRHQCRSRIGANVHCGANADEQGKQVVLLVRSGLFRRYPNAARVCRARGAGRERAQARPDGRGAPSDFPRLPAAGRDLLRLRSRLRRGGRRSRLVLRHPAAAHRAALRLRRRDRFRRRDARPAGGAARGSRAARRHRRGRSTRRTWRRSRASSRCAWRSTPPS